MDTIVYACGLLVRAGTVMRCSLGRGGVTADKTEGDGASPSGCFPLREIFYREDRVARPDCALPIRALATGDGWSDDPADPRYNRLVALPHPFRHERLWREDGIYDIVVPLGYNDDPPVTGRGSAIFLHVARSDYAPTEGCVALSEPDLRRFLHDCRPGDRLCIRPGPSH